jgi:hypothetical protein
MESENAEILWDSGKDSQADIYSFPKFLMST